MRKKDFILDHQIAIGILLIIAPFVPAFLSTPASAEGTQTVQERKIEEIKRPVIQKTTKEKITNQITTEKTATKKTVD